MIAPQWVAWMAENLLRGADPDEIVTALVDRGLDEDAARGQVHDAVRSPLLAGARRLLERSAGVEQAARLRRWQEQTAPLEVDELDDDTFFLGFFSAGRPAVSRGGARSWPAASWTMGDLADRAGDVEVEALVGRSTERHWWRKREELRTRMPFAELLRRCVETTGDDCYAVGRNEVLAEPGLAALCQDIGTLPGIDPDEPGARLWIGPAGTRTPLHHDQSSAWLVQVVGRKRVWFTSPQEPALMTTAIGVFNETDASVEQTGELAEVHWRTVDLEPGDAIFVPVGWWHQVHALTPSISVSLGGFHWPNAAPWYAPGR